MSKCFYQGVEGPFLVQAIEEREDSVQGSEEQPTDEIRIMSSGRYPEEADIPF